MNNQNCVAYMRYSTDNQTENSIEYQRAAIAAYCIQHNLILKHEFIDEAYSASNDRRPDFQHMIEASKNNPDWDTILVYDFSRIFRNSVDAPRYKRELQDRGIKIISMKEKFPDSAIGWFMESFIDIINAFYSQQTKEKTHAGMSVKAHQAIHCGGTPPLGYDVNSSGKLIINEAEAEIVREIFRLYSAGYSYNDMMKILNGKGLRTKAGKPFTKNSFYHILTQEKYIGVYRWNKRKAKNSKGQYNNHAYKPTEQQIVIQDGCPAIVPLEDFRVVQKKISSKAHGKAASKSRRHYMLGGKKLMKCANCGSWMVGKVTTSHGRKYITYACPKHKGGGCPTKDIKAKQLEQFVSISIVKELVKKSNLPQLNQILQNSDNKQLQQLKNRKQGVEKKIANLVKSLAAVGPCDELTSSLQQLNQEKDALKSQISAQDVSVPTITSNNLKQLQSGLANHICKDDSLETRTLLTTYINEISVDNDTVTVDFNF